MLIINKPWTNPFVPCSEFVEHVTKRRPALIADPLTRLVFPPMTMVIITMTRKRGIVMEVIVSEYFSGRIAS